MKQISQFQNNNCGLNSRYIELNEFVIQLDEEVEGMQSTILTLQQQLKGVKTELVEEKQSSENHVEQIRVLERNLDLARTQPPSPVEGDKPLTVEDMQYDTTDRTEAENQESGHEAMESECSNEELGEDNMKHEDKDSKFQNVEPELDNVTPDVENVSSGYNNVYSDAENVQFDVRNVQPEVRNVQPEVRNVQPEIRNVQLEVRNVLPEIRNVLPEVRNVQPEVRNVLPEVRNVLPEVRNVITEANNVSSEVRNASPKENEKIEPNLRKTASTPPCSAFSISQILGGEPKRTPSPDIPPGGDAVVTKIPYIGGYSDPTGDTLRTEGSGILNGDGKDGTPPIVT
jgi:chromosome segregation ATPase